MKINPHDDQLNKYDRKVGTLLDANGLNVNIYIDVYDVLKAFNTGCPAMDHAIKKCLAPGKRGDKSIRKDKEEAIISIERSMELDVNLGVAILTAIDIEDIDLFIDGELQREYNDPKI